MKVIVDENLPRRLCGWLVARGCSAAHVGDIGLIGASDAAVWAHALQEGAVVISRDSDFIDIARQEGKGCAVRLTIGNCSTNELFAWLETQWTAIDTRVCAGERAIEI
jgi:predicted nuclease of predicted toxin-antitoxin system